MGVRKLKELLGQTEDRPVVKTTNPRRDISQTRIHVSSKTRKREDFQNRRSTVTIIHVMAFLNFFARLSVAGQLHWILQDLHVSNTNYVISGGMLLFACLMVGGIVSPILIFVGTKISRVTLLASSVLASGLIFVILCFAKAFSSFLAFYAILGVALFLYIPLGTNLYIDCSLFEDPTLLPLAASALLGSALGVGLAIIGHLESFWSGYKVWRLVFLFQGVVSVIIAICLLKLGRDPRQKKWEVKKIPKLSTRSVYEDFIVPFLRNKTYVGLVLANTFNILAVHASSLMVLWFYLLDFSDVWTPLNYVIGIVGAGLGCQLGYTINSHFSIHPRVRVVLAQCSIAGALGTVYLLFDFFPKSLSFSRNFFAIATFGGGFCIGFPHAACDWPLLGKVFFSETRKNAFRYYWTFNSLVSSFGPCFVAILAKLAFGTSADIANGLRKGLLVGVGVPLVIQLFVYFSVLVTCTSDLKEIIATRKVTKVIRFPGRTRVNPLAPEQDEEQPPEVVSPRPSEGNFMGSPREDGQPLSPKSGGPTPREPPQESKSNLVSPREQTFLAPNQSEAMALMSAQNSEMDSSFALPHALTYTAQEEGVKESDDNVIEAPTVPSSNDTPGSPRLPEQHPKIEISAQLSTLDTAIQTSIELFLPTTSYSEDLGSRQRLTPSSTPRTLPPLRRLGSSTAVGGNIGSHLQSNTQPLSLREGRAALPPIRRGNSIANLQNERSNKAHQQKLEAISLPINPEDIQEHGYKGEVIPSSTQYELQRLIFGKLAATGAKFSQDWYEGFYFADKGVPYALAQHKAGPNGVLTIIQAFLLKQLVFGKIKNPRGIEPLPEQRQKALVAALREILEQSSTRAEITVVIIKKAHYVAYNIPSQDFANFYVHNSHQYSQANGIILFLYSVLLTHGIHNIRNEMDDNNTPLVTPFGMASPELINLFLTGRACSGVFDFDLENPEGGILHGISQQSQIGYLTQMEKLQVCQVGDFLKIPLNPIWLTWASDHFSLIFSVHTIYADDNTPVELHYFDPLMPNHEDLKFELHFTMDTTVGKEGVILDEALEECLRTKWPESVFVWPYASEIKKPEPTPQNIPRKKIVQPKKEIFW